MRRSHPITPSFFFLLCLLCGFFVSSVPTSGGGFNKRQRTPRLFSVSSKKERSRKSSIGRSSLKTAATVTTATMGKSPKDNKLATVAPGGAATNTISSSSSSSNSNSNSTSWLSRLRTAVFPIYGQEITKFLLIGSIQFFIILALVLSRDTKDTLIVTQCGAEAIAFLKVSRRPRR